MTPQEQWYLQMVLWPPIAGSERNGYQYSVDEEVAVAKMKPHEVDDMWFENKALEYFISTGRDMVQG